MNNIQITQLPNGIYIISEKITYVKSFSLGFWSNVGSRDENSKNNGISHFLEHMFFKGTKKRSVKKIAEDIESLGGYLNAFTSKEHTCFYGRGLSQNIEKTFEVLADMVQYPLFKTTDISKEAGVVVDELYDIEDTPDELIFDKFETNIFAGSSLALPIIGTEKNIKQFSREDLLGYIKQHYGFNKLYIVASGYVEHNDLVEYAKKYLTKDFGISKSKRKPVILKPAQDLFIPKESQQIHLILGKPTYGYKDKKRIKASVLSHILGEGSSSRLFQSVREKNGIAYQINTFLNSFYDVSTFGVYLSTNERSIYKAQKIVNSELQKISSKLVTEKELKRAKEYLIGNLFMSLESTTNRMVRMAQSFIYFNKIKTVEETVKDIETITKEDILKISNELFGSSNLTRTVLSSKNYLMEKVA